MTSDSQTAAGPQTEIVAKSQFDLWGMLPAIMPFAFVVVGLFLFGGIRDALGLLLLGAVVMSFTHFIARYVELRRAIFDHEGMTLLPGGIGRLRARPVHFRWDEVVEVRRAAFLKDGPIRVRLNRPRKFWTFRSQHQNTVLVPKSISADPRFAEALRLCVPAERIHAGLALDERLSWSARYWWVLVLVILVCAAVAAGCSFAIIRDGISIRAFMTATLTLVIGVLAMSLCAHRAPASFGLVTGLLHTFWFAWLAGIFLAFFISGGQAFIAGFLGASAGALAGAAMMVINGKNSRGWRYAGATFLLAAVGFWCGWAGSCQIAGIRVGVGSLDYRSPWTPSGDAFLMTEGFSEKPTTVCWYSSDLKLECRAVLPKGHVFALGQEAALFIAYGETKSQIWFLPRDAEAGVIEEAPTFGRITVSPDSGHALIPLENLQDKVLAWKICEVATGKVAPAKLPAELNDDSVIALRNDLTVLWLSGSRPLDKGNNQVNRYNDLPESGEFPHPGKPYVVWSWKINSTESPAQIYAAKTQWLEWQRGRPERLYVWRIAENPPARVEQVALDLAKSPPAEATNAKEGFQLSAQPQAQSFDGRFTVEANEARSFAPAFIVDTKTGRKFSIQLGAMLSFGGGSLRWSPTAHKFLMEVPEMKLAGGGLWRWHRESGNPFEITMAVYFVDMDRQ